ncbi:hypothetical protein [Mesorhizobium koreense]|uniref:hypothetical protein n=1 Tax=Mesorhizobium koreense TaxID=3074855 RepID=UPI00287B9EC8|nr:hypothetical protein [Mesorhizobium sp. WR6]
MVDLADRLAAVGFNLFFAGDGAGANATWLRHAVREFQIYASGPRVAQEVMGPAPRRWLDRLQAVANQHIYNGPKDGDENAAGFMTCLAAWETERYRCPVVVDVFCRNKGKLEHIEKADEPIYGNYWRFDDPRLVAFHEGKKTQLKRLVVRVCDLTELFRPAHETAPDKMEPSGGIAIFSKDWQGGYVRHGSDADEILPETLIGVDWGSITKAETKATFRVLRAISEIESGGRFDGINGYDDAAISCGPYNWALAPARGAKPSKPDAVAGAGELAPYLAYWAGREATDAKAKFFDPLGVSLKPDWPAGSAGPKKPSWPSTRNYIGRIDWAPLDNDPQDSGKKRLDDLQWMHTTHWFWRWLALSRYVPSYRKRQWDLGRARIRDILAFEIDPADRPGKPAGSKKVRLSKMFTSEVAVALLVRCHVRWASFLSQPSFRGPSLRLALAFANLPTNVGKWGDAEQAQLIEAVIAACAFNGLTSAEKKELKGKLDELHEHRSRLAKRPLTSDKLYADCRALAEWPKAAEYRWNYAKPPAGKYALQKGVCSPALSKTTSSFKLDEAGLPPMP